MDYSTGTRKHMADAGTAMSDGSYPIANRRDVANAVMSIGRTDPIKRPAVKAHIRKRAKALGATDLLPNSWQ